MKYSNLENQNELTQIVIGCAIEVHKHLGPGLLESAYEACLFYELKKAGLKAERQRSMPIVYKELTLDTAYRLDLLIEDKLIVEIKSIEEFHDIHTAQVLTYLKFSGTRLGLLINFNVPKLKFGLKRLIK